MTRRIALIGLMGAGKTSVGELLAGQLSANFVDTDDWIEREQSLTIAEIFAMGGETRFREYEHAALQAVTRQFKNNIVCSTGGGIVLRRDNQEILERNWCVVYLRATIDTLVLRLHAEKENRPLLQGNTDLVEKIGDLLNQRKSLYLELANVIIDVDGRSIENVVEEIRTQVSNESSNL